MMLNFGVVLSWLIWLMNLIHGAAVRELKPIADERGWLIEILRSDWDLFEKFGQIYVTTAYPGVVKAWHYHKKQTDYFTCIHGMAKLVLYDSRSNSPTYKMLNEFHLGELNHQMIKIPPLVYHGFKGIGNDVAYMINIPTVVYNYKEPDEFRIPPDTKKIPYDWGMIPGLKHG